LDPSRWGKTTLLNIVAGLERGDEGQVSSPDCNEHGRTSARCLSNPGYCRGAPSSRISDWCCGLLKPPRLDMRRIQRTGPVLAVLRLRIPDPHMSGLLGQVD
jgi:hypothetical protein